MNDTAMTVKEAASFLGLSTTTIYAQARGGVIPSHRFGKSWRFFATELQSASIFDPWARSTRSIAAQNRRRKAD